MFRRKVKGPVSYEEWDAALKQPLDYGLYEYICAGTLKQKELYASLFNRISDYVTGTFNGYARALDGELIGTEAVYELKRFFSRLRLLSFYLNLSFLRECDKDALSGSLKAAVTAMTLRLEDKYGIDSTEFKYEISRLKRAFGDRK